MWEIECYFCGYTDWYDSHLSDFPGNIYVVCRNCNMKVQINMSNEEIDVLIVRLEKWKK